jgi:hypothetical protein
VQIQDPANHCQSEKMRRERTFYQESEHYQEESKHYQEESKHFY